jgi:hypothetical protein
MIAAEDEQPIKTGTIGEILQQRTSATVHLPAGTSSWCWALRDVQGPHLAVVPDQQRLSEFVSDWKVLFPERQLHVLSEIPLTQEHISNEATRIERGSSAEKWRSAAGCIVATPPAVMTPLALPSAGIDIRAGLPLERDRFLEWADRSGYRTLSGRRVSS